MTPLYIEIAGLKISEPATFATDWVMGGLAAGFAWKLLRSGRHWWAAAFGVLSLSSFLGGTWHGLRLEHPWFNHNDLFHLIQILANTFLFLAARRTPPTQPVPG